MRLLLLLVIATFELTTMRSASAQSFIDVPDDHWAAAWIENLATEGITAVFCIER